MEFVKNYTQVFWNYEQMKNYNYTCGYCGKNVASNSGLKLNNSEKPNGIYICPNCQMPSFLWHTIQVPGVKYGSSVANVPEKVNGVYEEARRSFSVNAYTGVVLLCRKLLMHVAVDQGAKPNLRFIEYVNFIDENNIVGINNRSWIDQIRKFGNQATHEIELNSKEDAQLILKFCEMILKMTYEYPGIVKEI